MRALELGSPLKGSPRPWHVAEASEALQGPEEDRRTVRWLPPGEFLSRTSCPTSAAHQLDLTGRGRLRVPCGESALCPCRRLPSPPACPRWYPPDSRSEHTHVHTRSLPPSTF